MRDEIDQTELDEIEKEIDVYFSRFHVPPPSEQHIEQTIRHVQGLMVESNVPSKKHLFTWVWNELKYANRLLIFIQFLILFSSILVLSISSPYMTLGYVFCISPLSIVLSLTECLKNKTSEVTELEMTYKYGTGQLFLVRLIVGISIHLLTVVPLIIVMGIVEIEFVLSLIITWIIPAMTMAVLCLGLSLRLPSRYTVVPFMMVAWFMGSGILIAQQTILNEWISLPLVIHLIVAATLVFSMYKIIVKYQEAYNNGIEYSIN
ncbi:hypothetical protein [Psychrobacillus sp. OK032]|uniref:hypothetical protein n=1 Tax=Psychrobacillus sp. OK032 TaxID=1884358 RepID=UPI0008C1035D|nr:hypothetical protein [Psychrobacillus sp. OK032]SES45386.1 hypothetical protein SAMN05518872_11823 [Psychrobacillus sp. OK032]